MRLPCRSGATAGAREGRGERRAGARARAGGHGGGARSPRKAPASASPHCRAGRQVSDERARQPYRKRASAPTHCARVERCRQAHGSAGASRGAALAAWGAARRACGATRRGRSRPRGDGALTARAPPLALPPRAAATVRLPCALPQARGAAHVSREQGGRATRGPRSICRADDRSTRPRLRRRPSELASALGMSSCKRMSVSPCALERLATGRGKRTCGSALHRRRRRPVPMISTIYCVGTADIFSTLIASRPSVAACISALIA